MKKFLLPFIIFISTTVYGSIPIHSIQQIVVENAEYTISSPIDLVGKKISLPKNVTIRFNNNGLIANGVIIGNDTRVIANHKLIFSNVSLAGSWSNFKVYSDWVDLTDNGSSNDQQFLNLMTLCNGPMMTHLYMREGDYFVSAHKGFAPIVLPSNVYWHNKAKIHMLPSDMTKYNIVLINNVHNVTIDGGEFIGDMRDHTGTEGEWGHGIKCAGATNITLKNLKCLYCWGDGIDLIEGLDEHSEATIPCRNIKIDNTMCLYNRRQGISIEAAHDVEIMNSNFSHTGRVKSTSPSAGIDIEPWINNGFKIKNISILSCCMEDNVGLSFMCMSNWTMGDEEYIKYVNNINIEKCTIENSRVGYTNGIRFNNCVIEDIKVNHSNDVNFLRCTIDKYVQSENNKTPRLKKCKGKIMMLSYVLPVTVVGFTSLIALHYLTNNKTCNEKNRRNHDS